MLPEINLHFFLTSKCYPLIRLFFDLCLYPHFALHNHKRKDGQMDVHEKFGH